MLISQVCCLLCQKIRSLGLALISNKPNLHTNTYKPCVMQIKNTDFFNLLGCMINIFEITDVDQNLTSVFAYFRSF